MADINRAGYAGLLVYGDVFRDVQEIRRGVGDRLRTLQNEKGIDGGPAERLRSLYLFARETEQHVGEMLDRVMEGHPLAEFAAATQGLGIRSVARLLAVIGDPAVATDAATGERRERTVSQLWSYCGLAPSSAEGHFNVAAKAETALLAVQTLRNRCAACRAACRARPVAPASTRPPWAPPPEDCTCLQRGYVYRVIYDRARVLYAQREGLSELHRHRMALRRVEKEILKDLWRESRRVHGLDVEATPGRSALASVAA